MGRKAAAAQYKIDPDVVPELTRAVEDFMLRRTRDREGILIEARQLASHWKVANQSVFEQSMAYLTLLLAGLVVALRSDHELLEWIRQHRPKELDKLIGECLNAEAQAVASRLSSTQLMLTAKQRYERRRSKGSRTFFNSIEYQFGGGLEADDYRKFLTPLLGRRNVYENMLRQSQTCLDEIFARKSVNTLKLEELFWMDRHRFAKALRGFHGPLNYLAVTRIMDFLLTTKPRKKRDKSKPGPSPGRPWLCADALRIRVLRGIEALIISLHIDDDIANAFLTVIRSHLARFG